MCRAPFFSFSFLSSVGLKLTFWHFPFLQRSFNHQNAGIFSISALVQPGEQFSLFFNNIIIRYSMDTGNIAKNNCHYHIFIC
jgi:hypothetical protein